MRPLCVEETLRTPFQTYPSLVQDEGAVGDLSSQLSWEEQWSKDRRPGHWSHMTTATASDCDMKCPLLRARDDSLSLELSMKANVTCSSRVVMEIDGTSDATEGLRRMGVRSPIYLVSEERDQSDLLRTDHVVIRRFSSGVVGTSAGGWQGLWGGWGDPSPITLTLQSCPSTRPDCASKDLPCSVIRTRLHELSSNVVCRSSTE